LQDSFPFYNTVKTNDIFVKRQEQLDEHFTEMHDQPQKRIAEPVLPQTINENVKAQNAQAQKFVENARARQQAATAMFAPQTTATNQAAPAVNQTAPNVIQEKPVVNQAVPSVIQEKPAVNQAAPVTNQTAPVVNKEKPATNQAATPSENPQ
jgi:hypothetical protein